MSYISKAKETVSIVKEFISQSTIAKAFIGVVLVVIILNLIKRVILLVYSRKEAKTKVCRFLERKGSRQECSHSAHKAGFYARNGSCDKCKGKCSAISQEEIELRAARAHWLINALFTAADWGKALLPYLSFAFTLVVAAYITKSTK